jgi:hypothetical protein
VYLIKLGVELLAQGLVGEIPLAIIVVTEEVSSTRPSDQETMGDKAFHGFRIQKSNGDNMESAYQPR